MTNQTLTSGPSLAEAQLAVAVAALTRLSLIDEMAGMGQRDDDPELKARCGYAASTLEEIQRLADEAPEPEAPDFAAEAQHLVDRISLRQVINAAAQVPEPEPPLPPGKYGRVELPGRREHVGFIAEEIRFGQQCAVVRDWNGAEIACAYGGPGAVVVWLPQPLKRPEIRQPQQRAIGYGFFEDHDDDPWAGDGDDD